MRLSDEQQMIQQTARDFAQRRIAPFVLQWEREHTPPRHILPGLGKLGLMGVCIDPHWGGAGADMVSYVLATEEIAAADAGICNMMNVHNSPVCAALAEYGTEEQKHRLLGPMARGELAGAFLLTEPQAGSDAGALRSVARREGDHYVLNGTKQFITAGQSADIAMIVAVTDPSAGRRGITCFLTPTDNPGYKVIRLEDKLGHRNCDTCQIAFEEMRLPASDVLGPPGEGYRIALANLNTGRIGVAAQAVGVARTALREAIAYAGERQSFGKQLVEHQAIAFKLADMATKVEAARRMTLHAADLKDAGKPCIQEASMAKLFASEICEQVCSEAVQIFGGYGYLTGSLVEKLYRDARVFRIYEGTSEVQRMVIARSL